MQRIAKHERRICRNVLGFALFLLTDQGRTWQRGEIALRKAGEVPEKSGRPWAHSFLTLARFNLDWLTNGNDDTKSRHAPNQKP